MSTQAADKRFGVGRMLLACALAFGFAFALVPLYRIACEKVLGVRLERGASDVASITVLMSRCSFQTSVFRFASSSQYASIRSRSDMNFQSVLSRIVISLSSLKTVRFSRMNESRRSRA